MNPLLRNYLAEIGRRGGRRSRRTLTPVQARNMVAVREAAREFHRYRSQCFWSCREDLRITGERVPWVIASLRKNGNFSAWNAAARLSALLCR